MIENMTLEKAASLLDKAVEQAGGTEAAMEACDRMYRATFRSEPFPLNELEEWEEEVDSMFIDMARAIYLYDKKQNLPEKPDHDAHDYEFDSYYMELECLDNWAEEYVRATYPDLTVNGETLVVALCNYKGEGEGFGLYAQYKNSPVFRSKRESFHQINGY